MSSPELQHTLRQLPAVDRLLQEAPLATAVAPASLRREAAQEAVAALRQQLRQSPPAVPPAAAQLLQQALDDACLRLQAKQQPSLRHVINATGTLLHTNLGRAPLCEAALSAIDHVSRSYSNLELDLASGKRGHRYSHVDQLLCRLTGAEAAAVVNNNAGAVLLALAALAQGKQAIVSRGELVEIGGSFRIPEVMQASGVQLKEVGATNKTHLRDYQQALTAETGLLLKVHTSNYRIVGFNAEVSAAELTELGHPQGIPVMEDLGSGMLWDMTPLGLPREPTVHEGVAAGIDVLTFSGDKLLGGPQAGLIVGKKWAIDRIRHHPLARALRIDKLTLAALEATLRLYLEPAQALAQIPTLRMLAQDTLILQQRTHELQQQIHTRLGDRVHTQIIADHDRVGGGALPLTELPTEALTLEPQACSVTELARRLRLGQTPVMARIEQDQLRLHARTLQASELELVVSALEQALPPGERA